PDGVLALTPACGEMGIEYGQFVELDIPISLTEVQLFDGQMHAREPNGGEEPVCRPVGLFDWENLMNEFQKPNPRPQPEIVYTKWGAMSGKVLDQWMTAHPHS